MAPVTYKVKLTRPQVFLWRMSLFLILAILLAIILDGQTQQLRHSFLANPGLNALIIGVLVIGIVYAFRQVLRLYPEITWVNNFTSACEYERSAKAAAIAFSRFVSRAIATWLMSGRSTRCLLPNECQECW